MNAPELEKILIELDLPLEFSNETIKVIDSDELRSKIFKLVEISTLESGARSGSAQYLVRTIALEMGIYPASIHEVYLARGRGEVPPTFTVPAINLRALSFNAARAVFRVALEMDAGAILFEIARSEIGYTDQRPAEYATNIFAAAIAEGYSGPVFIQGDHFQISSKRYASDPDDEVQAVKDLIEEAIDAGFYNIDIDTSTLVDIDKPTVSEQQTLNAELSAMFTKQIRSIEPEGIEISVGGEIGEVGGKNSTEAELRAYTESFEAELEKTSPGATGLSKISIQTGTSHGGVVLPDGSVAEVKVDFDTLKNLSQIARKDYGMAGAVQHGASTLPQEAFGKFLEAEACEVHLATNFQNIMYDHLPDELRSTIYAYLDENHSDERKPDQTDEQFHYKTRKRAIGPFKSNIWGLPKDKKDEICKAWEDQFRMLFTSLNIGDTRKYVDEFTSANKIRPSMENYLVPEVESEDTSDLAD
ncbi:MAG: aldolase [Chloroflexi bacterium]|nr:aldolase [Chloroflexota bacterium]